MSLDIALRSMFTLGNLLYIALAGNYKTRSDDGGGGDHISCDKSEAETVLPTVTTRMTMMTTTTIKSVISMKVYNLQNDVSFLLPTMVPP
jgi:hypothetical protein